MAPPAPLTCELRALPAVSHLLGKRCFAVHDDTGWVFPRDVLEAVEAVDDVPLPARCGMWAVDGGVDVEVVVRSDTILARLRVAAALEARGVPLRGLFLRTGR